MFTVKTEYTSKAILNTISNYATSGKPTKDKGKLLNFLRDAEYYGYKPSRIKEEHESTLNYRAYVISEIVYINESILDKIDKWKWLKYLEHELYTVYKNTLDRQ